MGRLAEKVLLKEFVQEVLQEDDGGFGGDSTYYDLAMWDATNSPWGVSFGSNDQLYNIFVRPFVDVVQTAAGKTKELSQKAQTLVRVAFETIATTLIPVLTDSYNEIFQKEKENIDKIRQEYAEVYQANWDAFKDEDFLFLSFMYDPAKFIIGSLAKKAPGAAIGLLSTLTGGTIDGYLDRLKKELGGEEGPHRKDDKNLNKAMGGGGGYDLGGYGDMGFGGHMEGVIREDADKQQASGDQMLNNPKLIAAVNDSQLGRKMRQQAQQLIRTPLTQVYKQAQAVLKANSVQDLQQKLGKRIKGAEKLAQIEPNARRAAEQQLLVGVKK